jgi:hypothetical protein
MGGGRGFGLGVAERAESGLPVGDRGERVQQVAGRAREAVEPRHHEHVAGVELGERAAELRAFGLASPGGLAEHRLASGDLQLAGIM